MATQRSGATWSKKLSNKLVFVKLLSTDVCWIRSQSWFREEVSETDLILTPDVFSVMHHALWIQVKIIQKYIFQK